MARFPASSETTEVERQILASQRGDVEAFAWLYHHYVHRVYRYLYARVQDRQEAEDLTSQTFLAVLESLARYRHRGRFAPWLFTIARNKANEHSRRRRPHLDLDSLAVATSDPDPSSLLAEAQQEAALQRMIGELSQQEQELLRLRYGAELSFEEMARVLGKGREAVKKGLYRLLARLQARMENEHG